MSPPPPDARSPAGSVAVATAASTRPAVTTGVVIAFDAVIGLGAVRADDGIEVAFHCTQIADGSRHIAVGTPVEFALLAGRHGRWEAGAVAAIAPG